MPSVVTGQGAAKALEVAERIISRTRWRRSPTATTGVPGEELITAVDYLELAALDLRRPHDAEADAVL